MVKLGDEETSNNPRSFLCQDYSIIKMGNKDISWLLETCNGLVFAGYAACYLIYVGAGGLIFMYVEGTFGEQNNELFNKLQVVKDNFIKKFPNVTGNVLDDFVSDLSSSGFGNFEVTNSTETKWTFSQSLYFCMTLLTTIGYGHVAPVSKIGKAICMIYTSVGIPLTIFLLTACVQRLMAAARYLQRAMSSCFHRYCLKPLSVRLIFFIINFVIIGLAFFVLPAYIFTVIEKNWSYMDAFYFCFISLTTVGLGDFVPGRTSEVPHTDLYRISVSLYLLLGVMSLTYLMALATQCQECIFHRQSKVGKAPFKPPNCDDFKFTEYGSIEIVQEKVFLIPESKHHKYKKIHR